MPSVRIDTSPLIAGAVIVSAYPGLGIRGADAPLAGEHGPGLIGPALTLPGEADDEFIARILTTPVGLTGLIFGEDGTIEVPEGNPDGSYTGTYRLYKNGAAVAPDPQTYEINIGPSGDISGGATLDGLAAGGGLDAPNALAGGATLDGPTAGGGIQGGSTLTGGATLDGPTAGGGVQGGSTVTGDAALDGPGAAGGMSSLPNSSLAGDAEMGGGITAGGGMAGPSIIAGDATLDGLAADGALGGLNQSILSGGAGLDGLGAAGIIDEGEETVSFDVFLSRVLPHVPGAPDITVTNAARAACIEWFQRTLTWRDTIGPGVAVAAETVYTLALPPNSALAKLTGYWINEIEGRTINVDRGMRVTKAQLTSSNVAWVTSGRRVVNIYPAPIGGEVLAFQVALKPTQAATTLLADLWEHYAEQLEYGALARIFRMPKQPWTDLQLSAYYEGLFKDEIDRKGAAASKAFSRDGGRVRGFFY